MAELLVIVATHHFVVTRITPRAREAVNAFAKKFVQYGMERKPGGRFVREAKKVFAAATADRTEYRFHINTLPQFHEHLKFFQLTFEGAVEFQNRPMYAAKKVELKVFPHWQDREYQIPFINYLLAPEPRLKLGAIQTGKGKSYSSMRALSEIGEVVLTIVKPKYIEKWIEDYRRTYDLEIDDIMVVQGSKHLQVLLEKAVNDELETKIILVSNKTIQMWLKLYEKIKEQTLDVGYACLPDQLCEAIRAGSKLVDEVHEDFHLNFKIDMYTHVEHSISLSATLLPDDPFLKNMCEIAYPSPTRYNGDAYHKYIAARAVIYRTKKPEIIRSREPGATNYSHYAYEKYVMKHPDVLKNYLNLIGDIVQQGYIDKRSEGHRCLVFCSLIEMCTLVTEYLKKRFPHLDTRRYMEDDPYEDLMEPDICVSSLQNAGTAVDIPGLLTVVMTVAITSSQGNVQGFGRLRELKGDLAATPWFFYFVNEDVQKHIDYHEKKKDLLKDRALNYNSIRYNIPI